MHSKPVIFPNQDGLKLFGVLHEPRGPRQRVGIVLLSPGIKMRVGPHRLYSRMAEEFVKLGFPVLRFDFTGLGDSEGEIEDESLMSVYNSIQSGRFVDDTVAAMNWMQSETGVSGFVLGGLCGGAITGLLTGAQDPRMEGLLSLGIPVNFEGGKADFAKFVTQGQLKRMHKGYLRKLTDPVSWRRLLTFKSDYRVIGKILRQVVAKRLGHHKPPKLSPEALANLNPKFGPAFLEVVKRRRPILLVFSGADRLGWEFEEKFAVPNEKALRPYQAYYQMHTVEKANHVFSLDEWQEEMLGHARGWLRQHFVAAPAGAPASEPAAPPTAFARVLRD